MKKSIVLFLLFTFFFLGIQDADAQRKRRTKKRTSKTEKTTDKESFKSRLAYEIGIGNPSFLGGGGGSTFNFALKPGVGYIVSQRFSPGVFVKTDYLFVNQQGSENFNLFDYGAGAFVKFKIVESIYLRGEYTLQSYSWNRANGAINRENFVEPLLGLGYKSVSPGSKWGFGGEILFHLKDAARDYVNSPYEFWLKFDYKF